eukprot:Sspe_Gene.37963::Locus_18318_Transcript_1_2_Confidence_0.800_Length_4250::g.37963::m.37963
MPTMKEEVHGVHPPAIDDRSHLSGLHHADFGVEGCPPVHSASSSKAKQDDPPLGLRRFFRTTDLEREPKVPLIIPIQDSMSRTTTPPMQNLNFLPRSTPPPLHQSFPLRSTTPIRTSTPPQLQQAAGNTGLEKSPLSSVHYPSFVDPSELGSSSRAETWTHKPYGDQDQVNDFDKKRLMRTNSPPSALDEGHDGTMEDVKDRLAEEGTVQQNINPRLTPGAPLSYASNQSTFDCYDESRTLGALGSSRFPEFMKHHQTWRLTPGATLDHHAAVSESDEGRVASALRKTPGACMVRHLDDPRALAKDRPPSSQDGLDEQPFRTLAARTPLCAPRVGDKVQRRTPSNEEEWRDLRLSPPDGMAAMRFWPTPDLVMGANAPTPPAQKDRQSDVTVSPSSQQLVVRSYRKSDTDEAFHCPLPHAPRSTLSTPPHMKLGGAAPLQTDEGGSSELVFGMSSIMARPPVKGGSMTSMLRCNPLIAQSPQLAGQPSRAVPPDVVPHKEKDYGVPPSVLQAIRDVEMSGEGGEGEEDEQVRAALKEYGNTVRGIESLDLDEAMALVTSALPKYDTLPARPAVWSRVCFDASEALRRANRHDEAYLWMLACAGLRPRVPQCWVELSKMEEEFGNPTLARAFLYRGLKLCKAVEARTQLMTRLLRHMETHFTSHEALRLLAPLMQCLRTSKLERSFKILLEVGGLLSKHGEDLRAKRIFSFLRNNITKQGAVYLEAAKMEVKLGRSRSALELVKSGVESNPRYGPIVFLGLRLIERIAWEEALSELFLRVPPPMSVIPRQAYVQPHAMMTPHGWNGMWRGWHSLPHPAACYGNPPGLLTVKQTTQKNRHATSAKVFSAIPHQCTVPTLQRCISKISDFTASCAATISKDLLWKTSFETAMAAERMGNWDGARMHLAKAAKNCPPAFLWKVWLAGARVEVSSGMQRTKAISALLTKALQCAPTTPKFRTVVHLEVARLKEYYGDVDKARECLLAAQQKYSDWRLHAELLNVELRASEGKPINKTIIDRATTAHPSVGRIWALCLQLYGGHHKVQVEKMLRKALQNVPKAGEVWCEGARLHMNPLSKHFDLEKSAVYLNYAIRFTPQYGDSFIEMVKLKLLTEGVQGGWDTTPGWSHRLHKTDWYVKLLDQVALCDPNFGILWHYCKLTPALSAPQVLQVATTMVWTELAIFAPTYQNALVHMARKAPTTAATATAAATSSSVTGGKAPSPDGIATMSPLAELITLWPAEGCDHPPSPPGGEKKEGEKGEEAPQPAEGGKGKGLGSVVKASKEEYRTTPYLFLTALPSLNYLQRHVQHLPPSLKLRIIHSYEQLPS